MLWKGDNGESWAGSVARVSVVVMCPDLSVLVRAVLRLARAIAASHLLTANGGRESRRTNSSSATRFGSASRNNC